MKILALTNLYPPQYLGGYELICYMVVNELRTRGHTVNVLTSNHQNPGEDKGENEAGIERSLRIHGFYGHPWLNMADLRLLERHNNERLRAAIEKEQPDLVYVWNMGGLSKSMVFTLQRMGIPTVFYLSDHWIARGFSSDVWLQWWNRSQTSKKTKIARRIAELCGYRSYWQKIAPTNPEKHLKFQRLYFCSKALRKLTASAGFEVMHGAVIYPPVDIQKFNGRARTGNEAMRNLLWVGRLSEDKGIMTALKAMDAVKEKFSGELHVYGKGESEYVNHLKKFAQDRALRVTFRSGGMGEMPEVYRKHDALIFTSEWAEPFALTPLEAMASGLPVIGTMTGGSREIFRHGDNALTYTAGNAEELGQRIIELAENNATRARIAETGQKEVRDNYSLPSVVDQIEDYLNQSVETWSAPGLPFYNR
jgi:glycogen(starch) synthase